MTDPSPHAAADLPLAERQDYLRVLAALAHVDGQVAGQELGVLRGFCEALDVTGDAQEPVVRFAHAPDPAAVRATCERLRGSQLRFTLVTDLLYIAHTDARYTAAEREVVEGIAELLQIHPRQLEAMDRYARAVLRQRVGRLPDDPAGDDDGVDLAANAAGSLAACSVPLAAVAAAGGGAGLGSGLATLGAGLAAGLGVTAVAAGVGVAAGIGVGSFLAVRGLYRALRD